jgi:hypothetical protein
MLRVNASWHIAFMTYTLTRWDRANEQLICDPMGRNWPTIYLHLAITLPVSRGSPKPTARIRLRRVFGLKPI